MVISLRRIRLHILGLFLLMALIAISFSMFKVHFLFMTAGEKPTQLVVGGYLCFNAEPKPEDIENVYNSGDTADFSERFQRPSKQPALKLKYSAKDFINHTEQPPYIKAVFESPDEVIQAYYAILRDAANMAGYYGGCGTVGWAMVPYPYAYELLSSETRKTISLEKFEESFKGIGHTTLLKLYPAYQPPGTPENEKHYMVELEVITGPLYKGEEDIHPQPSYFAYYYGIITVEKTPSEGWKIKSIKYLPEDFLCHPYHHWDYLAEALVGTVYKNWYGLVNEIESVEKKDSFVQVYAAGSGNRYRFDFARLANGDDVLLHENILENGQWKEVNLLKPEHQIYMLSVINPLLSAGSE